MVGIIKNMLEQPETLVRNTMRKNKIKQGSGNTASEILNDDDEVERLSKYIADDELKKIINKKSGVLHGVEKIGTKNDSMGVLKKLLSGASKTAKERASKILVNKYAERNLKEEIFTKKGSLILGKKISRNIYIKRVSYERAGKTVSYLQARNLLSGRIVSMNTALKLIGRYS